MESDETRADLPPVTVERGEQIRRRRMALGIRSVSELAEKSGVSRSATSAAEHGDGSVGTYERLEAWLTRQEDSEVGRHIITPSGVELEQMEVTVSGDFGVIVTAKAPIGDRAALQELVVNIVRGIRGDTEETAE